MSGHWWFVAGWILGSLVSGWWMRLRYQRLIRDYIARTEATLKGFEDGRRVAREAVERAAAEVSRELRDMAR